MIFAVRAGWPEVASQLIVTNLLPPCEPPEHMSAPPDNTSPNGAAEMIATFLNNSS